MTHPLASDQPYLCAVCRRQAMPLGYRPHADLPMLWTCGNPICQALLPRVYGMTDAQLPAYEEKAGLAAGNAAGQWLDDLGKTDLAILTAEEWREFLWLVISGHQAKLREMIRDDAVPF
jgi:hypothetical protein